MRRMWPPAKRNVPVATVNSMWTQICRTSVVVAIPVGPKKSQEHEKDISVSCLLGSYRVLNVNLYTCVFFLFGI
jgi:hypothetical protein